MTVTTASLRQVAARSGLDGFGVCTVEPFLETRHDLERRTADGMAGRLRFTFADPRRATDVRQTFPWAARLVVGGRSYLPSAGSPGPAPARPSARIARFAVEDFYAPLARGLQAMAATLIDAGHRAEILVDDNRLVDRAAAVRAGVGWWGKNTMVLAPRVGPWLLLGSVVTDAEIEVTPAMVRDCGTCVACLPACPTGALVEPGILDASRCLSHWAQVPGVIPVEYRIAMGDRIYGCDDCLDVCPPGARLLGSATRPRGLVDIEWVLAASDDELLRRFDRFYIPRRDPKYLRRNALIALGNTGEPGHARLVRPFLEDADWLLRAHAVWAYARLAGPSAGPVLAGLAATERRPEVLEELAAAPGADPGDGHSAFRS